MRLVVLVLSLLASSAALADDPPPFEEWLSGLIAEARERGYSDELVESALVGLTPIERVIQSDRSQAEVTVTFDRYYAGRVTPRVVRRGREMAAKHRTLLRRLERDYGVQRRFLLAVWGLESRFGANTGRTPIFQALATLAWEPRRSSFFRAQLFDALTMVRAGYIDVETMTGSWAGAMGQPQFMPSSYLEFAVDYDGDGRRDIWSSTPDVLASIANYLKAATWDGERTWGREVRLTPRVRARVAGAVPARDASCFARRNMSEWRPLGEWQALGVRRLDRGALPGAAIDASLVTTGERSFLVYRNYDALLSYNCAHHYALAVSLLADRLR
jgi:membrane-bound lytic murein transglycosylase B